MRMNITFKKSLEMGFIVLAGFVLFNVAFLFVALLNRAFGYFALGEAQNPKITLAVFVVILIVLSWLIFKSKMSTLLKATYLTMPLMSLMVIVGIYTTPLPQWVTFSLEGLLIGLCVGYIRMKHLEWEYTFSVLYCTVLGLIIILFNVQI